MSNCCFVQKSKEHLSFPFFMYSVAIFILQYILSTSSVFDENVVVGVPLQLYPRFDPAASDPLVILVVMEVYKFEHHQKALIPEYDEGSYKEELNVEFAGLMKQLLILHYGKLLSIALLSAII